MTTETITDSWSRPRNAAEKRAEALDLLDVTEADLLAVPKIEPLLREAQVLDKVWDYLELGREYEVARKMLLHRERLKAVKLERCVPFEAYCLSAKVVTLDCIAVITKVMKTHVDLLNSSKKLGGLHDGTGTAIARSETAVLPPIEDDIRSISERFNEQARQEEHEEPDEEEEDDREEEEDIDDGYNPNEEDL